MTLDDSLRIIVSVVTNRMLIRVTRGCVFVCVYSYMRAIIFNYF